MPVTLKALTAAYPAPDLQRKLLAPTRWQHGDVALMCLSAAQLGYSWLGLPEVRMARALPVPCSLSFVRCAAILNGRMRCD